MKKNISISLGEIAERLKGELKGPANISISGVASVTSASPGDITFITSKKYLKGLAQSRASAVIIPRDMDWPYLPSIRVENPYYSLISLLHLFYDLSHKPTGVDERAVIGKNVHIGKDVSIYPFVYIDDGVTIGDYVIIYPWVFIGKDSSIGDYSTIYPNVTIREEIKIGRHVIIHSGAVIGSDGFGYIYHDGKHTKIPQVGGVIIEDDVEIGAGSTVDRATLGNTVIKKGTKIDNLVQIAHNVVVGEDCIMAAQTGIAGSTEIGKRVTFAGQAGVTGHIQIGDNVTVAGKAGVTKNIRNDQIVSGMPAIPHKNWLEIMAIFRELPQLKKRILDLEKEIRKKKD